ncbi:MAG: hypothetical protein Q8Q41_01850 [bacterium]|nr:hypothetical protein [bacterium]
MLRRRYENFRRLWQAGRKSVVQAGSQNDRGNRAASPRSDYTAFYGKRFISYGVHRKILLKKLLPFGVALVALVLAASVVPTVHAANPVAEVFKVAGDIVGGITLGAVLIPLAAVIYGIGLFASTLVWIAGWIISFGVDLNNNILAPENAVVGVGWSISRDLANLGFVLVIIFIAFATILRFESYGVKKTLFNLIVAALLVNFSLVIAGVILDFAGVISNFFISKISDQGWIGLSTQITAGFAPQAFLQTDSTAWEKIKAVLSLGTLSGQLNLVIGVSFATLLTFIVALTLLTLAAMFMARYVILSLLLAVAPLAWLFWTWPGLEQHWKTWWAEFIRWVFFMPSATFFLYLALTVAVKRGEFLGKLADEIKSSAVTPENVTAVAGLPEQFGQAAAVIGLAIGGLMLSYKVGGMFSVAASMTGGWVAEKLQAGGKGAGKAFSRTGSGWYAQKMAAAGANAGTVGRTILAPVRGIGKGLRGLGVGAGAPIAAGTILSATWQGAKKGFIKKKPKDWQCQTCTYTLTAVNPPALCPGPTHPAGTPSSFVRV